MAENNNPTENGLNLPFSIEAEQAVIGSVLIDQECFSRVINIVKAEYFYLPQHRAIFEVCLNLFTVGKRIDPLLVLDRLKESAAFDDASGKNYLVELASSVPSTVNVEAYCHIVKDKFLLRTLITISRDTIDSAVNGGDSADMILDLAEQKIYDIRKGKSSNSPKRLSDVISNEVYPTLQNITGENADEFKGLPTGFAKLDESMNGLNKSDLILIGARPAMGKTSLALNMARNVAIHGKKVLFFSLEMSSEQLASRVLATEARVESQNLRSGKISNEEWVRIAEATNFLTSCDLYFDDSSDITVPEMKAKIRRLKNVDCVFIDYLGLMKSAKKNENRVQEITEITRGLKLLAKDMKIPVVTCCQLSRGPEKNPSGGATNRSKRPQLSDLRDSGSIEQDADIVLMLYRDAYYKNDKENAEEIDETKADLDIAKNRHGPTKRVLLRWDAQYTMFTSADYEDENGND